MFPQGNVFTPRQQVCRWQRTQPARGCLDAARPRPEGGMPSRPLGGRDHGLRPPGACPPHTAQSRGRSSECCPQKTAHPSACGAQSAERNTPEPPHWPHRPCPAPPEGSPGSAC